ncbi:MAG: exosortase-associated EpsI family protein [Fimbriimonadaceae bacterium]
MEIVRKRLLVLGTLMCAIGIVGAVAAQLQKPKFTVTEPWMESKVPTEVDGYKGTPAPRADQATYDALQPFGIVSTDFRNAEKGFNVMLIAGDKRETFHSPNVCLPAQGLVITNEHDETINTRTRGTVPITIAELQFPSAPDQKEYMAFFYRVQNRFLARSGNSTLVLTWAMFQGPIRGNFDENTVFYRIITEHPNATKEELRQFVAHFLDAAHDSSDSFF